MEPKILNAETLKETKSLSPIAERKIVVDGIIKKHSEKLFDHPDASIKEIRYESIKRNLESTLQNS